MTTSPCTPGESSAWKRACPSWWDESPQSSEGCFRMNVCLPQAGTWIVVDVARYSRSFAACAEGGHRVAVGAIKEELQWRLSMFCDKEIYMYKCSAERPRGDELHDSEDVYYLTWLIAWAGEVDIEKPDDWEFLNHPLKWSYKPPTDTNGLLKVLVYIEPCYEWQDIYLADLGTVTNGKVFTTVGDMKKIILAGFEDVTPGDSKMELQMDHIEVKRAKGSHADGDNLAHDAQIYHGKWYYVTANKLLEDYEKLKTANEDIQ